MPPTSDEPILRAAAQRLVFRAIRTHPDWTLLELVEHLDSRAPVGAILGAVDVAELSLAVSWCQELDLEPPEWLVDSPLDAAQRARGSQFDALVHEVLAQARGPVRTAYLRQKLGSSGPKLSQSLSRLIGSDLAERSGTNSRPRYRARER